MQPNASPVLRVNSVEEESAYLRAVSQVIGLILAEPKPDGSQRTLIEIAEGIDVQVKTISNAFNAKHSLCHTFLFRLGKRFGAHVLDPVAALLGARMTPLEADDQADPLPSTAAAVHSLAIVQSAGSPGGTRITHTELLEILPEVDAAIRALTALKVRAEAVRAA